MSRRGALDRRALLRGASAGVVGALALPRLEAMLNNSGTAYAADGAPLPKLFGVWFWGNGIDPKRWVPAETGAGWTPSEQLAPLADAKPFVSVVTGCKLSPPRTNEPHVNGPVGILTGDDFEGADFNNGTVKRPSLDQIVAKTHEGKTKFRSLELRVNGYHGGGTAIDHISHNGPGNPNRGEIDPKVVYGRLFGADFVGDGGTMAAAQLAMQSEWRRSALDVLLEDAKALRSRLGKADQTRLDQHMDGVRALEQRLKAAPAPAAATCNKPAAPEAPATIRARNDVMARLLAMAWACDLTRVATFEFTTPASHVWYPEVEIKEDIHEWGHTHGVDDLVNKAILFFMQNLAAFLGILKDTPDGAGTLLDRALVFGTSCTAYGPTHGYSDWPLLLAGRAGGAVKPGLHVRGNGDESASRVPLTILRALGVDAADWGVGPLRTDRPFAELLT